MAINFTSADWTQDNYNPAEHNYWKATLDTTNGGYPKGYYFADTMRAISVAFGQKFADIFVIREDEKGYPRKQIQVPIKFGPRSKAHDFRTELETSSIDENGVVDPKYYIQYPCLTWKFTSGNYDSNRQTSSNVIRTFYDRYLMSKGVELKSCDLLWQDMMVIPVNIGIQLTAYADKDADLQRMFEQIVRKTKDSVLFLYVKEFWFMNIRRDIKVQMSSFTFDYGQDDMGEDTKREVKCTFEFNCEAFIYRPIEDSSIITQIVTTLNLHINNADDAVYGISGNMYMNEKYSNSAEYAEAIKNKEFKGSWLSAYDFTNNGNNIVGPELTCTSSYYVQYNDLNSYITQYSANYTDFVGSALKYIYEPVPNTIKEYNFDDTLLDQTVYVFGTPKDGTTVISGGEIVNVQTDSPVCITAKQVLSRPYRRLGKNHYSYGHKYIEDSKQNIINAVYATSHKTETVDK